MSKNQKMAKYFTVMLYLFRGFDRIIRGMNSPFLLTGT